MDLILTEADRSSLFPWLSTKGEAAQAAIRLAIAEAESIAGRSLSSVEYTDHIDRPATQKTYLTYWPIDMDSIEITTIGGDAIGPEKVSINSSGLVTIHDRGLRDFLVNYRSDPASKDEIKLAVASIMLYQQGAANK